MADEVGAALAMARGSGFRVRSSRRPYPGEIHAPGTNVVLRSGEWCWSDFIPDGSPAGYADRAVQKGMQWLEQRR